MDSNTNFGKSEDRISVLPDSILHQILSFLDGGIKNVARTCVLSKRWRHIWTSIPTLKFPYWLTLSETDMFMDFVDRTLIFRDGNIQDISFNANRNFNAARVHLWISIIAKHNVQKLHLSLQLHQPFIIPLSLFTCQSLIELHLDATSTTTQLPKTISFPNLKTLTLTGIEFTDDCCWNETNFPVLEKLDTHGCTWFNVRNFCISTPTLKWLYIWSSESVDGLRNCALQIHAPSLVEFTYMGNVAKEYVLSDFQKLKSAVIQLRGYGVPKEQRIGYVAAMSKFFLALSHVESLTLYPETLETMSTVDDFANILPTFHDLKELMLDDGETTDKSLFQLLKAAPNVTFLEFERCIDEDKENEDDWDALTSTAGCLLQHLKKFDFIGFSGNARQMRWVKLILKNAKTLESINLYSEEVKNKEVLVSKLRRLPRASDRCEIEFDE